MLRVLFTLILNLNLFNTVKKELTEQLKEQIYNAAVFIANTLHETDTRGVTFDITHKETGQSFFIQAQEVCSCKPCFDGRRERVASELDRHFLASIIDELNAEAELNKEDAQ